jgi:1-deoxy-D-xylulose-5-phosphate reductoisomerase
VLAQLANTDMRIPIQYALTYPERIDTHFNRLNFYKIRQLTFEKPDYRKFPCLSLAREAAEIGGSAPCVLNAANEEAVNAFLEKKIKFIAIPKIIEKMLKRHKIVKNPKLDEILEIDTWTRNEIKCFLS